MVYSQYHTIWWHQQRWYWPCSLITVRNREHLTNITENSSSMETRIAVIQNMATWSLKYFTCHISSAQTCTKLSVWDGIKQMYVSAEQKHSSKTVVLKREPGAKLQRDRGPSWGLNNLNIAILRLQIQVNLLLCTHRCRNQNIHHDTDENIRNLPALSFIGMTECFVRSLKHRSREIWRGNSRLLEFTISIGPLSAWWVKAPTDFARTEQFVGVHQ